MNPLSAFWLAVLTKIRFAFQPVVNIHSGAVYGFEALLRGWDDAGFLSIHDLFDTAYREGVLYALDYHLREKVLGLFKELPCRGTVKLFYNLDNRLTEMPDYTPGNTMLLLERMGLEPSSIVFEVSERHQFSNYGAAGVVLERYKSQNFRIAVDDFGAGYSGLQLLYFAVPDLLKIDRFFIADMDRDRRKRLFAESIVSLAHLMGLHVVAEGVETEEEFYACRQIGCDLVQGYLIARPTEALGTLSDRYRLVGKLVRSDKRHDAKGRKTRIKALISRVDAVVPITAGMPIMDILDRFREDPSAATIPVPDEKGECTGVLHERDFRPYVYSPFGISLLKHESAGDPYAGLLSPIPVTDVSADIKTIQNIFLAAPSSEGVVVYEDGKYLGFLGAKSILASVSERDLSDARDQNPLTKLAGNARLEEYLSELWNSRSADALLCYFDFNDFKPFNDHYGFRRGDRVILLFADILRDYASRCGWFIAHIGGDDFFAGISLKERSGVDPAAVEALLRELCSRFAAGVTAFYDAAESRQGFIEALDRDERPRRFPLMAVSVGVLRYRSGQGRGRLGCEDTGETAPSVEPGLPSERLAEILAGLKKRAKQSGGYAYQEL